ncbi:MAG: RNA-binding domain-containing protein [Euryarchaeota archaeon]|nr:RNA-binding domain-containing protein [Euryarchaeota archaeon]
MIGWIKIESFCQSTESEEKVLKALKNLCDVQFKEETTVGHYGNPIGVFKAKIKDKKKIKDSLTFLNETDMKPVDSIGEKIDRKGRFHLRLDKQKLYAGDYALDAKGDVHITIKFITYPLKRNKVIKNVQKILGN